MSIIIGIDHGYYAIKTAHCSFPAGLTSYGEHEPYTRQGLLEFSGCFFVCGTGRQPIQRDKTINDNYYLLTLAAIAKELKQRGLPPECSVRIAAGLPLTSFGRDKPKFKDYLLRSKQPVNFRFEGVEYSITIEEVAIFPQGYAALMTETGLLQDEPSMLLMDLGGWTVDLMRIDNAIPAADTAHSLELGMIRCVDDIREQVRRETGLSLTDAQIENLSLLLSQPDASTRQGLRDLTLLALLYDSGARVQELVDLRLKDVRLTHPPMVILTGKGRKVRQVPLMKDTCKLLDRYIRSFHSDSQSQMIPLFYNAKKQALSRYGVTYILKKYAAKASPVLEPQNISPHVLRHTKAMHLLRAGVNMIYIRDFLGHADISTTEVYARIDAEMKRKVFEEKVPNYTPNTTMPWEEDEDLLQWLTQFGKKTF